jgi:hypothetical protein
VTPLASAARTPTLSGMELSAEQRALVASWVAGGESLAEVQRRLESEFKLRLTYMDVRFLIDDLALELPPKPEAHPAASRELKPTPAKPEHVVVEVDKLVRPGALVSGSVTFTDGKKATWMLDQMGRLGLDGVEPTYRPSEDDLADFQIELQAALRKAGFG